MPNLYPMLSGVLGATPEEEYKYDPTGKRDPFQPPEGIALPPAEDDLETAPLVPKKGKKASDSKPVARVGALSDRGSGKADKYHGALLYGASDPNRFDMLRQARTPDEGAPSMVSADAADASQKPKQGSPPPIPTALLERLRTAQLGDSLDRGSASLGRLLLASAAGAGHLKDADKRMQDYLDYQSKSDATEVGNLKAEEELKTHLKKQAQDDVRFEREGEKYEREKKAAADAESTTSPLARFTQMIAISNGFPAADAAKIPAHMADEVFKLYESDQGRKTQKDIAESNRKLQERLAIISDSRARSIAGMEDARAREIARLNREQADRHFGEEYKFRREQETMKDTRERDLAKMEDERKRIEAAAKANGRTVDQEVQAQKARQRQYTQISNKVKDYDKYALETLGKLRIIKEQNGGTYPGVGRVAGMGPNVREATKEVAQLTQQLVTDYRHSNYGATLTAQEKALADEALGAIGGARTQQEFERGLGMLQGVISGRLTRVYAGVEDKAVAGEFIRRTGLYVPGHPIYGFGGEADELAKTNEDLQKLRMEAQ